MMGLDKFCDIIPQVKQTASKNKKLVVKKVVKGKFEAQVTPGMYFKNYPNHNLENCKKHLEKEMQEVLKMREFVGDSILRHKATNKVNANNELPLIKLRDDKLTLFVDSKDLTREGNPRKLYKKNDDETYTEDTSKISHIAMSVSARTDTPTNCNFCGRSTRHPLARFKNTPRNLFEHLWERSVKTEGLTREEAEEKYRYMEVGLICYYLNNIYSCKNCNTLYIKKIQRDENGKKFHTKSDEALNLNNEIDGFLEKFNKAFLFDGYNKACIIQNHNYKWNASLPGTSEKIVKQDYREKFLDD